MKKLFTVIIIVGIILGLSFWFEKDEQEFIDDFCALNFEEETLYIDGNYSYFINDLSEKGWNTKTSRWWSVFYQFEDVYSLLRNDVYDEYISINHDQIVLDLQDAKSSDGPLEFESSIELRYRHRLKSCTKNIKVYYYDLYQSYKDLYGNLDNYDYSFDIEGDGYYSISYDDNGKRHYFNANMLDDVIFTDGDIVIRVEEKYLGTDFIVMNNDSIIFKRHLYDYSEYFHSEYNTYLWDDGNVMVYKSLRGGDGLWLTLVKGDPSSAKLVVTLNDIDYEYEDPLILNEVIVNTSVDYMGISYKLVKDTIVEVHFENSLYIWTKRIIIE